MVKFLHTADIHLDTRFSGIRDESKRKQRRAEHRECFARIIDATEQTQPDFLLIAGDLFEQTHFSPDTINFIVRQLERIYPLPIFLVAGNHDLLVTGSPYLTWEWPSHVHIFQEGQFQSIEIKDKGVVIHGASATQQSGFDNLLRNFSVPQDERMHIVLFHGSEATDRRAAEQWGSWLPFTAQDILSCGADYCALGHYHGFRSLPFQQEEMNGYYPGCPEPTKLDETGAKYILEIKLEKGSSIQVEKIQVQSRQYREEVIDCNGFRDRNQILERIKVLANEDEVVKIVLEGYPDPALEFELESLRESVKDWFFASEIENRTRPDYRLEQMDNLLALRFHEQLQEARVRCEPNSRDMQVLEEAEVLGLDALLRGQIRGYEI